MKGNKHRTEIELEHHTNCTKGDAASHVNAMGHSQALHMRFTRQICLAHSFQALRYSLKYKTCELEKDRTEIELEHHTNCTKRDTASHVNDMGNMQTLHMHFTRQICLAYSLRAF